MTWAVLLCSLFKMACSFACCSLLTEGANVQRIDQVDLRGCADSMLDSLGLTSRKNVQLSVGLSCLVGFCSIAVALSSVALACGIQSFVL